MAAPARRSFDIYLSFTGSEQSHVETVAKKLRQAGFSFWPDPVGREPLAQEQQEALSRSRCFVLFLGAQSLEEIKRPEIQQAAIRAARDRTYSIYAGVKAFHLFLVLLPDLPDTFKVASLPFCGEISKTVDLRHPETNSDALEELLGALREPEPPAPVLELVKPPAPAVPVLAVPLESLKEKPVRSLELEQAENIIETQQRRVRLFRWVSIACVALAIFTLWLSSNTSRQNQNLLSDINSATRQQQDSDIQQKLSRSRELAANAVLLLKQDPELALQLAIQGVKTSDTEEAISALRRAMAAPLPQSSWQIGSLFNPKIVFSPDGENLLVAGLANGKGNSPAQIRNAKTGNLISELEGTTSGVISASFSPDGKTLLYTDTSLVRLIDVASGKTLNSINIPGKQLLGAVTSPDGRWEAIVLGDGTVQVWNSAVSNNNLLILQDYKPGGSGPAFSPDSKLLAIPSGKSLKVYRVDTGEQILDIAPGNAEVVSVAWSGDGQLLATGNQDGSATVWDVRTSKQLAQNGFLSGWVRALTFIRNNKSLLIAGDRNELQSWEFGTGRREPVYTSMSGNVGALNNQLFTPPWTPGGKFLLSSEQANQLGVQNLDTSDISYFPADNISGGNWALRPDAKLLAVAGSDGVLRLWTANQGEVNSIALNTPLAVPRGVIFSPDSHLVATVFGTMVQIWDSTNGKEVSRFTGGPGLINSINFSPDSRLVVTGAADNTATVWEASSGNTLAVLPGHSGPVLTARFSPDGKLLVTGSGDNTARVWNTANWALLFTLTGHESGVQVVRFSPDNKMLLTIGNGTTEKTARVWDPLTGRQLYALQLAEPVRNGEFSPDGNQIVTVSGAHTLQLWNASTGRAATTFEENNASVLSATFSPESKRLFTVGSDRSASVIDIASGRIQTISPGLDIDDNQILASFSPDGNVLATTASGSMQLREVYSGEYLTTLRLPGNLQNQTSFTIPMVSPDGRHVLGIDVLGKTWILDCDVCRPVNELLQQAGTRSTRQLTPEERQKYFHE